MGIPSSQFPEVGFPPAGSSYPYLEQYPRRREPIGKYLVLFFLTLLTTTWVGAGHYASFYIGWSNRPLDIPIWTLRLRGLWYSIPALAILGAHEFGHYFACRYYRVDASRPYFLPLPIPGFFGTLGAVIRIRERIAHKRALFDIGIAGPIAGFVIAVPVLLVGMYLSSVVRIPDDAQGVVIEMGEPLLFKMATWLTFGSVPAGYTVNMHPMAFAAWFGMLATALNLFPIGQLDGGHISYAVLGRGSTGVTVGAVACLLGLALLVSSSWMIWATLTIVMLFVFGPRHPSVFDEDVPLDRTRIWLAWLAVAMFVLCFTPTPIELKDLVGAR